MLCGIVWGLWIGFGIVAAGTFLGEMANYIVFKYWCMERAHRAATKSPLYMSLHYIMGNSGILLVIVARLSAIPG
jgi:uncharacterized membrane protein YdjX (TVP38/TMEM64 family)